MSNPSANILPNRRGFVQGAAATLATSVSARRVWGANERLGVGLIGFGLIGKRHATTFKGLPDVQVVALAEAHEGRLDEGAAFLGGDARKYRDFRRLLDDRAIEAVIVATPDHWHAPMTMLACAADKDVYVEKPVTLFPREGRWMLDVARRHKRVVQVGTQQRSGPHYERARELIRSGQLGKIVAVRMQAHRNIMPGFGSPTDRDPPADLDWEMFLGPSPLHKYNPHRGLYHFRWFWDTAGGQMTNLGHHALDIVDWILGTQSLRSVTGIGGRSALQDNGETPDTMDALFEFPGWTATWSHREASRGQPASGLEFCGTKGTLTLSRSGFILTADRRIAPENAIPQFGGAHPVGGPVRVKEEEPVRYWTEAMKDESGDSNDQFTRHARNFIDCVKSRRTPVSDLESGQRVSTLCHLANLSLRLGRQLRWDAKNETILGDEEAARRLSRPYRAPWDAELKKLLEG
jgi:predicted dehydrogenase